MKRRQNNLFYWFRYLVLFVLMFAGFVLLSPGSIHAQENAEEPVPMTEPSEPTQIETTPVPEVSEQSEPTDDTIPAEPIQSQEEVVPETPAATPTNNPIVAVPAAKATTVSQPALHTNVADTSWQSDWTYTISGNNIILQDYKGSDSEYKVPAVATINGVDYSTIFGRGGSSYAFKNTAIKKLTFEEGVRLNTNASYLFYNNKTLESVDFTGVDASQTTNMQSLFYNATAVKNVIMDDLNTEKVTNMRYLFYNATGIETLSAKNVDFTSVTTLGALFNNSSSTGFSYLKDLRTIDLTGADFSRVTSLSRMFSGAMKLETAILKNMNVSNVTNLSNFIRFYPADSPAIKTVDVSGWNTSKVTNFSYSFYCLKDIESIIGLEDWDTSSATSMNSMFQGSEGLTDLSGVQGWNTSKVTNMGSMFSDTSVSSLDLSGWDTSNVTNIGTMFRNCANLTDLKVSTWDTSKVTSMQNTFQETPSLKELDLTNWSTESLPSTGQVWLFTDSAIEKITFGDKWSFIILNVVNNIDLPSGFWNLDGVPEKKFTPSQLYKAYNDGYTPPGTYLRQGIDVKDKYEAHGVGAENLWEVRYPDDKMHGYCINARRAAPNGYYGRVLITDPDQLINPYTGYLESQDYGWIPIGDDMRQALIALIYYGWENDGAGLMAKYGLTESDFRSLTQAAIWHFTDNYSSEHSSYYMGDSDVAKAYRELISLKFADIPNKDKLKLYLYISVDGKQNLLSIAGLHDQVYAGVAVYKMEQTTDGGTTVNIPLAGAEFTIYDQEGNEVGKMVSDSEGIAAFTHVDAKYGLPMGIYTIRETKVPRGYRASSDWYEFEVREIDDGLIITKGFLKGSGIADWMMFTNTDNTSVTGGGLIIEKMSEFSTPLSGAEFTVYDENNQAVGVYTSGADGLVYTGIKDLELNKSYTIRETKAPKGYHLSDQSFTVVLTENKAYFHQILQFMNPSKRATFIIDGTKIANQDLSKNTFMFQLLDSDGQVIQTATNDSNGQIQFVMEYNARDIGYYFYTIREVDEGNPKITYDSHAEEITVWIDDIGEDALYCWVETDEDGIVFTNTIQPEPEPEPQPEPQPKPQPAPQPEPQPEPQSKPQPEGCPECVCACSGCVNTAVSGNTSWGMLAGLSFALMGMMALRKQD